MTAQSTDYNLDHSGPMARQQFIDGRLRDTNGGDTWYIYRLTIEESGISIH